MRERGGYWYKNDTLIEMLDITQEEQRHLKNDYRDLKKRIKGKTKQRYKSRRNENGLTEREQQKSRYHKNS